MVSSLSSEIHPDYFQIPVADREELLALQNADIEDQPEITETPVEDNIPEADEVGDTEDDSEDQPPPEVVGGENDTGDESNSARRMARFLRNYRIQEVIRRRQIILVQVVKKSVAIRAQPSQPMFTAGPLLRSDAERTAWRWRLTENHFRK